MVEIKKNGETVSWNTKDGRASGTIERIESVTYLVRTENEKFILLNDRSIIV